MTTADTFENLKKLQDILVKKYALEAEVEDAPKQLSSQEELLARMKKEFIEKSAEYDVVKDKVSKLKFDLDEAVRSRESGEKGMDNITTHREYEALEKQILEATDRENSIRKDLQKEEKTLEEINENLKASKEMIDSQEADLSESKESLNKELNEYNNSLNELKIKEEEITPNLDQEILFKFQRIIQRNSEGIVAVKNGVCTGCHMILPAQFANTVREGDSILFCPYCSRILFYEETDENAEDYFSLDEAGSLADFDDEYDEEGYDEDEDKQKTLYDSEESSPYYDDDDDERNLDDSDNDDDEDQDDIDDDESSDDDE